MDDRSLYFVNTALAGSDPVSSQNRIMMLPLSPEQPLSSEGRGAGSVFLGGGHIELLLVQGILVLGVVKDVVYGHGGGPGSPLVSRPHDVGYQHLPAHDKVVRRTSSGYETRAWPEWN